MTKPNLKPCPFCGGAAEIDIIEIPDTDEYGVICEKCHACAMFSENRYQAIGAWNTRTTPTVQEAAKVLLGDPDALRDLVVAFDTEDSAQRGEPNPHSSAFPVDEDWTQRRLDCGLAALQALTKEQAGS
jgi:Lar family restriction alleviation protein